MPTDHRSALAGIKRFDQLVDYLREEMAWPIEGDDFEELTFEYTPEELGIDVKNSAKIQDIKRLRPLAPNQPWGIFFVKFEPKRLPVVALRRILSQVTLRKRASANIAERQAWDAEDLLFVSNYGEGEHRQISFAHFAAPAGSSNLPTLKVLGWDGRDTALHIDHVARELTEHLAWPDDEDDVDAWREHWRAAFTLGHREVITTAQQLSTRLAALARATRDSIRSALDIESEDGRITRLMTGFREALIHDLDADGFSDMFAQTIAYGLLSARIVDPQQRSAANLSGHMRTNPLLHDLMANFLRSSSIPNEATIDFDELGVAEVIDLLDRANMEAVLRDFGDRNPREDPVIHFYENFVSEYDKQQKVERGVFYTPRPVVSYIVRSIDALLRSEFGLMDGLADTATWGDMAVRHKDIAIPEGISQKQDFVQILDPATGTGTFLVEVIDVINGTLKDKWQAQGHDDNQVDSLWNEYVSKHLLPRLHGYELLMAPYAIAHLKIGLKLYETGYHFGSDARARVYLTNALEPAQSVSGLLDFAVPALAHEAQAVNEVKAMHRFTVILGNPPYSGHSANKGEWIRDLLRGKEGNKSVENYFAIDSGPLNERNPKWLYDDYVKFIRLAHWHIERTGRGIVGFITNHSYLDNPTFRGMRESLTATFAKAYLLDLHGNAKKKERAPDGGKDQNVFDIQQGVAVSVLVNGAVNIGGRLNCFHADLWGTREELKGCGKYEWLCRNHAGTATWVKLSPKSELYLFVPRDATLFDEYQKGWKLPDVFPVNSVGIATHRDKLAIQWTAEDIEQVIADFSVRTTEAARHFFDLGRDARDWKVSLAQDDVRLSEGRVIPILYRPFDRRFTYYTGKSRGFIGMPRPKVMRHMLIGENIALCTGRAGQVIGADNWDVAFVSKYPTDLNLFRRGGNCVFPLYTYPENSSGRLDSASQLNFEREFVKAVGSATNLAITTKSIPDPEVTVDPNDLFYYIYAVLYSPEYRRRYADFMKSDFPRIPLPGNRSLFMALASIGRKLVAIHLMETTLTAKCIFPVCGVALGDSPVESVRYTPPSNELPGRVWINGNQYFEGVAPSIWAFTIGGYRPAEKWLKDRKGRSLSKDDIAQYSKIIAALAETRRRMTGIDDIIDRHGGWPAAFQPGRVEHAVANVIPLRPRTVDPKPADRYVSCAPRIPLQAAAGAFGDPQTIDEAGSFDWAAIDTRHRLRPGMFVAQVVGMSMEPVIPDGAWCLFRSPVEGTRQGKTVLVQLRDATDPETGRRYTVKRYRSEKAPHDDSWKHTRITLNPANPDFDPIVLTTADEGEVQVIAELVEVLGSKA